MPGTVTPAPRAAARPPNASIAHSSIPTRWPSGCRRTASPARCTRWTRRSAAATACRSPTSAPATAIRSAARTSNSCPNETLRYTDRFDRPEPARRDARSTVTLKPVLCGTELRRRAGRHSRRRSRSSSATWAGRNRWTLLAQLIEARASPTNPCSRSPLTRDAHDPTEHSMTHAPQIRIPATYMRGGTSKGVFFRLQDLPEAAQVPGPARDALLMRVIGSPDPYGKHTDGMGGATSSTSKCVIISQVDGARPRRRLPVRPGVDRHRLRRLERQLRQPVARRSVRSRSRNGLIDPARVPHDGIAIVRIWQANIGKTIVAHVPMHRRRRCRKPATSNSTA